MLKQRKEYNMKVKYSDLKNKRIFITGGGSGIGASIVEHFCEQGSEVYFVDIDLKETKKLLNKIKKNKFRLPKFIECNLLDINKLENIIKNIITKKGPIHALVNNAANDDRHTTDQVDEKFEKWISTQESSGKQFTPEQKQWLVMIKEHIAASAEIKLDDMDYAPFNQKGGRVKFYETFGDEYESILNEMHEVLVSA